MKNTILIFSLLFTGMTFAATDEIQSLKNQLKDAGVTWQVDDTWLRQRSKSDIKRMLGVAEVKETGVEFAVESQQRTSDASPQVFDWRNVNGVNYVSPLLDQGNCGSCVSFAGVATLETQMNINYLAANMRFSTQAFFACGGGACDFGWTLESASAYLKRTGIPDEACLPYTSGMTGEDVACEAKCSDASERSLKIVNYTTPTSGSKNLDKLRTALQKGPLFASFMVYSDFLVYKSGVYKHTAGKMEGGHAISIVGYDDAQRALIIRNSWGETWGMNGYALVSYDDVSGIGEDTWLFETPKIEGYVAVQNPTNKMVVSDVTKIKYEATFPNLKKLQLVQIANNKQTVIDTCASDKCEYKLNTKAIADGMYEVMAVATFNNQTVESQHQYFYVQNEVPVLSLNFEGKGVNLNNPLKGRVEFNIRSHAGVSPLTELTFYVKSGDKIVATKSTKNILPEMTMGWRTSYVPNGKYDIYMEGKLKIDEAEYKITSSYKNVTIKN